MVTLWKGAARPTEGERRSEDAATGSDHGATAARGGRATFLSLVDDLERNWALSAALILAAVMIVSAL